MSVTLTEKAAQEIQRTFDAAQYGDDYFLRVGLKGGGCSGFSYDFRPDQAFDEKGDTKLQQHGVTVVVDKKSALYLDGVTIDYYDGLDRRGFTFENPNAVKTCGCGSSFQA